MTPDRACGAMLALGAVAGAKPLEAIPLHHTCKTLALGSTGDVDKPHIAKDTDIQTLAELILVSGLVIRQTQLAMGPLWWSGRPGIVADQRLGRSAGVNVLEAQLHRAVPVGVALLDLGDDAGTSLDHGDGDIVTLRRKVARHPDFSSQQRSGHGLFAPGRRGSPATFRHTPKERPHLLDHSRGARL